MLKNRPNFNHHEIQEDLENIYEDDDGQLPDISLLQPTRKRGLLRGLTILGAALLVLAVVAWLGFFIFNTYAPENIRQAVGDSGDVTLTIDGPKTINSGEEAVYTITYTNKKKVDLYNVSINLRYPNGLVVTTIEPQPRVKDSQPSLVKEDNWDIGTVGKGQSGEITITGRLIAEAEANQNLWVIIYYQPANFSSTFQKEASYTTTIGTVPVSVTIAGPTQLATTDTVDLTITYANRSAEDLADVLIEAVYPEGFALAVADPAPVSSSDNQWKLPLVAKDREGTITIQGKFATTIAGNQDFLIKLSVKETDQDYFLIAEVTHTVAVISGQLLTELKINGVTDDTAVNFGDTINYSLTYQNTGENTLEDLTATVLFINAADVLQWTTLNDRYDGALDEFEAGKLITWTANEVPNLKQLKPGEKGVIDFSVRLVSSAGGLSGDLGLQNIATLRVETIDGEAVTIENQSNKVTTRVNSDLSLSASGRYFNDSGVSIGRGPIPPKVGQTTTYVIIWQLENSVHEVRDGVVSTVLPGSVTWVGKRNVSAGEVQYDIASRTVSWSINRMPTTISLDYEFSFEVSITPQGTDVGKILALTGDTMLSATDQVTGARITQARGSVTTDLVSDPVAKGKGLVTE
ncbi:hypothetical protein HY933_04370 [Candidatus Falkowbacteria bacterium]|nr:hypothetical protein [Candidatus Falkowbacteria bacterium]